MSEQQAPPWIASMTRLLRKVGEDHERAVRQGVEFFSRAQAAEARGERLTGEAIVPADGSER
jgi:hypothetical protein